MENSAVNFVVDFSGTKLDVMLNSGVKIVLVSGALILKGVGYSMNEVNPVSLKWAFNGELVFIFIPLTETV